MYDHILFSLKANGFLKFYSSSVTLDRHQRRGKTLMILLIITVLFHIQFTPATDPLKQMLAMNHLNVYHIISYKILKKGML